MENDLHIVSRMVYGRGLADWVYIRVLARELSIPENTIHRWWYADTDHIAPNARLALHKLLERFNASHPDNQDNNSEV
ncbi:MAG: hypothetical protein HQL50_02990 [Magnetococcales bacterium]|nr:hypothetical protein [Magnetococcales bacterium]